jgi:hypothetical protein
MGLFPYFRTIFVLLDPALSSYRYLRHTQYALFLIFGASIAWLGILKHSG